MIDPDAGTTSYVYNGFGEIYSQTDTNGNTYTMSYDNAGRLTQKTGPEGNYIYTYVPNGEPGAGLVQNIKSPGDTMAYIYNDYGLPTCIIDTIGGTPYTYKYTYDNLNNNTIIEYPNFFRVKRHYDANGQLDKVKRDDSSDPIWELNSESAFGQATQIKQGNNITTNYTYNQYNFLTLISPLQNDSYVWTASTGNLYSRTDNTHELSESFTYDNLDRLTAITRGTNVRNISFQANGNIGSKYDAGSYTYDPVKIHSISKITDTTCASAIDQALQNITYTPFKKVKTIQQNNDSLIYTYGQDMERRKMQLFENGQLVKTRIYCGMYEKETDSAANVKQYCYIAGGNGVTAVLINEDLYFLRRDVQGTITGLIDRNNNLVEEYSYDAWGRRRNPSDWTYDSVPQPQYLYRGYTMHEMLDEFGLINMNGRCYDPVVGRFLSPDIVVQNANNTQCYNRYSYAVNNPLKYTDPSGWSFVPSVYCQPCYNGMRQHIIDKIYSKIWKPNEFNELSGLLEAIGGNSLNNAGENRDYLGEVADLFKASIGNMEQYVIKFDPAKVKSVEAQYKILIAAGNYEGAAAAIIDEFGFNKMFGKNVVGKYLFSKGAQFQTSPYDEAKDENNNLVQSIITLNVPEMTAENFGDVVYSLYHEMVHVIQHQCFSIFGEKRQAEREFMAYTSTFELYYNNSNVLNMHHQSLFDEWKNKYKFWHDELQANKFNLYDQYTLNFFRETYNDTKLIIYDTN